MRERVVINSCLGRLDDRPGKSPWGAGPGQYLPDPHTGQTSGWFIKFNVSQPLRVRVVFYRCGILSGSVEKYAIKSR